ncbi:MAG: 6-pyruvoyl tetrahydropterin synthase [Methanoregula sp. PtaU1.Bin051]|nr:MAG: 6-pyruvoyl tetrahydropterin synthase [Methanoregula sp. PtaU1.Bin051]
MITGLYKEVQFDASHRLLHYKGKCANLHGHRWKAEVWMEGEPDEKTGILIDYNTIKEIVCRFDHQIILNEADPMIACINKYQQVIVTPGEPTSELLAVLIKNDLQEYCRAQNLSAKVVKVRIWESPNCYAEVAGSTLPSRACG